MKKKPPFRIPDYFTLKKSLGEFMYGKIDIDTPPNEKERAHAVTVITSDIEPLWNLLELIAANIELSRHEHEWTPNLEPTGHHAELLFRLYHSVEDDIKKEGLKNAVFVLIAGWDRDIEEKVLDIIEERPYDWTEIIYALAMKFYEVFQGLRMVKNEAETLLNEDQVFEANKDFISDLIEVLELVAIRFKQMLQGFVPYSPQLYGRLPEATDEEVIRLKKEDKPKRPGRPPAEKINYKIQFAALQYYAPELDSKLSTSGLGHEDQCKIVRLITGASGSVVSTQYFGKEGERVMRTDDPNRVNKTEWPKLE